MEPSCFFERKLLDITYLRQCLNNHDGEARLVLAKVSYGVNIKWGLPVADDLHAPLRGPHPSTKECNTRGLIEAGLISRSPRGCVSEEAD